MPSNAKGLASSQAAKTHPIGEADAETVAYFRELFKGVAPEFAADLTRTIALKTASALAQNLPATLTRKAQAGGSTNPFADAMVALAQTRPNRMVTVRDHGQMHPSEWASAMGTLEARGLFRRVDVPDRGNLNFVLADGDDERQAHVRPVTAVATPTGVSYEGFARLAGRMFMFAAEARASLHGAPVVTVTALRTLAKSAQTDITESSPMEPGEKWIVMKRTRQYVGGDGYMGPSCYEAGVEPGKVYNSREEAVEAAEKLSDVNPSGFQVFPYKPAQPINGARP